MLSRRWGLLLIVMALLAAGWAAVWRDIDRGVLGRVPILDEAYYLREGAAIARGRLAPDHPLLMSPLYPYLVAATASGRDLDDRGVRTGPPPYGIRILQVLAWLGVIVVLHRAGRAWLPPGAALAPPFLFALHGPGVVYATTTLLEIPLTFAVLMALRLSGGVTVAGPPPHASGRLAAVCGRPVGVGLVIGLAGLLRPTALLLLLPCALALRRGPARGRRLAALGLAALLPLLPAALHNSLAAGRLMGVSANGGLNLFIGNSRQATGFFTVFSGFDFENDPAGVGFLSERLKRSVAGVAEADRLWAELAWDEIREQPLHAARLWLKKAWLHFVDWEIDQITPLAAWNRESPPLRALPAGYGMIAALGLTGLVLVGRRPPWRIWAGALLVLVAGQSVFFVVSRYRMALVPILCLLAGAALAELASRRGRRLLLAATILVAAFLVTRPWGLGDLQERWDGMALANEAVRWERLGGEAELARAQQLYETALAKDAGLVPAVLGLSGLLARTGRDDQAERILVQGVLHTDAPAILLRELIGVLLKQGRTEEAVPRLYQYLRERPEDPDMLHNLAVALAVIGRPDAAAQTARELIAADPEDPRGYIDLGVVLARAGRREEARVVFERGLTRCPDDWALKHNLERLLRGTASVDPPAPRPEP